MSPGHNSNNILQENPVLILILLLWVFGLFYVISIGKEEVILYVFTVGAWAVDAFIIKQLYKVNSIITYPDLSFVCIISYSSGMASDIGNQPISQEQGYYYFLALIFMFTLWSGNLVISKYGGTFSKRACFMLAFGSVVFLIAGIDIMDWIVNM